MPQDSTTTDHEWLLGLYEISKRINASLDVSEIAQAIAREARRFVAFDRLMVGLLENGGQRLRLHSPGAPQDSSHPHLGLIELTGHALGHVVTTRQALFLDDLATDERVPADRPLAAEGLACGVVLPLMSGSRMLGALGVFRARPEPFQPDHLPILREVAERTAIALDHARLYAAEKKRATHLSIINEVAKQVLGTFDLDTLLQQTASLIQSRFAYYDVSIFLVDEASQEAVLRAQAGSYRGDSAVGYRQALDAGMVGWTARTGRTRVAGDVSRDSEYVLAFEGERASRSELCVPICIGGRTAGVINIESPRLDAFDDVDIMAIETLSDEVAQAIDNARVYDELRYYTELNESILAAIPSAILVLERDQTIVSVNESACRLLERSQEQILGQSLESLLRFDLPEPAQLRRTIAQVADHAARHSLPAVPVELPTGGRRIVDVHLSPVARRGERRALLYLNDITEQRRAEEDVRREQQKLRDIVSAVGAGLVLIDREGVITWSNSTIERWFGGGESLVGRSCHLICDRGPAPCPECPVRASLETGETQRTAQTVRGPQDIRHFENIFAPIRDAGGGVHEVIRLTFEVTDHVHKVEQLSLLQRLVQAMQGTLDLDRLLHLVLTCVTAGPGLGFNRAILLLVDEAHANLVGRLGVGPASGEEAARIWGELSRRAQTLPELLEMFDRPLPPARGSMQYVAQQIRIPLSAEDRVTVRALNEKRPVVVHEAPDEPAGSAELYRLLRSRHFVCVPLVARGASLGVIVADKLFTGQPIGEEEVELLETFASHAGVAISAATAYKRLEEQINQIEEAQERLVRSERLATVGRLAAHVAHEIRNPLVTIGGFARSILRKPGDASRIARNAQIILDEVERLEQILANVMNFTKPGKPVLHERDLNELVEAVCAFHESLFADRDIRLLKSLDPTVPPLRFDSAQIRQVLLNLVQNAADSMPDGGDLTVRTRKQDDRAEIVVADTGQGMSQDVLDNLFQPFYTTKVGGTGLGLSVSQKIVHEHGGDIAVQSRPGAGSSFTVSLPLPHHAPSERSDGGTPP